MSQPSWPFEYSVGGTWVASGACHECGYDPDESQDTHDPDSPTFDHEPETFEPHETDEPVLYLLEGTQLAYGTKAAWDNEDRF